VKSKKLYILLGATIGLLVSIILVIGQKYDVLFFLSGAPYYLDSIIIRSGLLVSYVCFIYFILLFSFLGYLFTIKLSIRNRIMIFVLITIIHMGLVYLGGKGLFGGFFESLKIIGKKGMGSEREWGQPLNVEFVLTSTVK
jgi:hypothetical protein